MCFSVRQADVCAGEEKRTLRKSALCVRHATEKRILAAGPHGKAHSAILKPPKLRFSVRQLVTPSVSHATSPAQSMWFSMAPNNNAYTSRSRACSTGTPFPRRYACC